MTKTAERVQLRDSSRLLAGDPRPSPAEMLRDAAQYCEANDGVLYPRCSTLTVSISAWSRGTDSSTSITRITSEP